jgi:hypothetical protein
MDKSKILAENTPLWSKTICTLSLCKIARTARPLPLHHARLMQATRYHHYNKSARCWWHLTTITVRPPLMWYSLPLSSVLFLQYTTVFIWTTTHRPWITFSSQGHRSWPLARRSFFWLYNRYPASKHTPHKSTAVYRKNQPNLTNNKIINIKDIKKLFNLL